MVMSEGPIGAIEAGGTKFICAFGSSLDDILTDNNRISIPTGTDPDRTLADVIAWFRQQETRHSVKMRAIGLACFGPVCLDVSSPEYGHITTTPKPNWSGFDIVGTLENAFPGLPVGFDTDVNGAALGEWQWGAAQGLDNFVYITIGTGIGAGAMVNGKLLHGMMHPEMGHMHLHRIDGDLFAGACEFHRDCWEGLCSGVAILQRTGKTAEALLPDHEAWGLEARYIAQAITNMIYILSPQKIIIGGSIMKGGQLGRDILFHNIQTNVLSDINSYLNIKILDRDSITYFITPPGLAHNSGIAGALLLGKSHPDKP